MPNARRLHYHNQKLNSGQWAIIANEAEEIVAAIAAEVDADRRARQAASLSETHAEKTTHSEVVSDKKLSQTKKAHANDTATKLAETFPTNRTYHNQKLNIPTNKQKFLADTCTGVRCSNL